MTLVQAHWGLSDDPFPQRFAPFVATPVHAEAVARILHAVGSGDRRISLRAAEGLGKTAVLDRVAEELRGPGLRLVRVQGTHDLAVAVLAGLGARGVTRQPRESDWTRLSGCCESFASRESRRSSWSMTPTDSAGTWPDSRIWTSTGTRISIIDAAESGREDAIEPWSLAIGLSPLTRAESGEYLKAKLALVGRRDVIFTDRAVTAIHSLTAGEPKGLDRLASLAMIAGAANRLEIVTPEVVHGVFRNCVSPRVA